MVVLDSILVDTYPGKCWIGFMGFFFILSCYIYCLHHELQSFSDSLGLAAYVPRYMGISSFERTGDIR